jgi:hypothetical protein
LFFLVILKKLSVVDFLYHFDWSVCGKTTSGGRIFSFSTPNQPLLERHDLMLLFHVEPHLS